MAPQIFQVLRCFECQVFQVHQVKKAVKWGCKMCGEKQSVKKRYGIGTAKECRLHVQKLNGIRGEIEETNKFIDSDDDADVNVKKENPQINSKIKDSKWSNYVESTSHIDEKDDAGTMYLDNSEVVLELPMKARKRKSHVIPNANKFKPPVKTQLNDSSLKLTKDSPNDFEDLAKGFKINNERFLMKENLGKSLSQEHCQSNYNKLTRSTAQLPKIPADSKWAQFVEDNNVPITDDEFNCEEEGVAFDKTHLESDSSKQSSIKKDLLNTNSLFSLCDDNELDDILDF